jgi:hypothetical protein
MISADFGHFSSGLSSFTRCESRGQISHFHNTVSPRSFPPSQAVPYRIVMEFICDEKYQNIIEELEKRGWRLSTSNDLDANAYIPRDCNLIWKNLSKTRFPAVLGRFVNHIKGIHHLSNKSYLVYHLRGAGLLHLTPPTWSSSCQSISALIGREEGLWRHINER